MKIIRTYAAAGAAVVALGALAGSLQAQNPVTVRRDTVVTVHEDTVVHVKSDTAVVTTTVRRSGMEPAAGNMTIAATLAQLPNYKTLVSLLDETHLLATLRGGAKFTVFAPTDDAFAKLPPGTLDALRADTTRLRKLLLNHVVSGAIDTREILKLKTARTLEGSRIRFEYKNGRPMVNDNAVVQPGIMTRNGFVYGIDGVINSPE